MYSRSTLFLAAAIFAGSAATAGAADVYNGEYQGSIKDDAIETILVPEAVHIPETMSWYLRGDIGYGTGADVDTSATLSGVSNPNGVTFGGLGFGRYLSPNTRIDFTFDYRGDEDVFNFNGERIIDVTRVVDYTDPITGLPATGPVDFRLTVDDGDVQSLRSHTAMANFYYDFARMRGLRPYIGAGLGITMHEVKRTSGSQYVECEQLTINPDPDVCVDLPATLPAEYNTQSSETKIGFGLAASIQAGLSYQLSDAFHVDTSYRVTYSSGSIATTDGLADIETGDRTDQEVRIGLRYDIW